MAKRKARKPPSPVRRGTAERRQRFVLEYIKDLNATQAAIRAGYAPRSARQQGQRLLSDAAIASQIADATATRMQALEVDADRVLTEIARIAVSDPREMFDADGRLKPPSEWSDDVAAAISGVDVETRTIGETVTISIAKVRRADKLRALELLAKYHGLLKERVEHTVGVVDLTQLSVEQLRARALAIAERSHGGQ